MRCVNLQGTAIFAESRNLNRNQNENGIDE